MPVRARIAFKVLLISFKIIKDVLLKYLADLIAVLPISSYDLCRNNNGILLARSTLIYPSDVHANSYPHRVQGGGG